MSLDSIRRGSYGCGRMPKSRSWVQHSSLKSWQLYPSEPSSFSFPNYASLTPSSTISIGTQRSTTRCKMPSSTNPPHCTLPPAYGTTESSSPPIRALSWASRWLSIRQHRLLKVVQAQGPPHGMVTPKALVFSGCEQWIIPSCIHSEDN